MSHRLFRTTNLAWALAVGTFLSFRLLDPTPEALVAALFWAVYLLAALGVCLDLRIAWTVCAAQLVAVWVMMGMLLSEGSFAVFTGRDLSDAPAAITMVTFNCYFGILMPASGLLIGLVFSYRHLVEVFARRPRRPGARRGRRLRAA